MDIFPSLEELADGGHNLVLGADALELVDGVQAEVLGGKGTLDILQVGIQMH